MPVRSPGRRSDLKVVFADLNLGQPKAVDPFFDSAMVLWPRQVFDAAVDSTALLNREIIDVMQRNLNANFSLLRKLVGARSFAEVIELQAAHLSNQVTAMMGQGEELATLSAKAATEFIRGAYLTRP